MKDLAKFADYRVRSQKVYEIFQTVREEYKHYKGFEGMMIRMRECGDWLKSAECPTGAEGHDSKLVGANFCRARWCPTCQWRRGRRVSQDSFSKFSHVLAEYGDSAGLVFLTLTLRNRDVPSSDMIDRLIKSFKAMRRRKLFQHCLGGIWALEITERGRGFHPHIHALLVTDAFRDGRPFLADQQALSDAWYKYTGDSYIVGVQGVYADDGQALAHSVVELCKYPLLLLDMPERKLPELYTILHGRRMLGSFGVCRGIQTDEEEVDLIGADCGQAICSVCGAGLEEVDHYWDFRTAQYQVSRKVGQAVGE